MASAGERRGNVGIVGIVVALHANSAATIASR